MLALCYQIKTIGTAVFQTFFLPKCLSKCHFYLSESGKPCRFKFHPLRQKESVPMGRSLFGAFDPVCRDGILSACAYGI